VTKPENGAAIESPTDRRDPSERNSSARAIIEAIAREPSPAWVCQAGSVGAVVDRAKCEGKAECVEVLPHVFEVGRTRLFSQSTATTASGSRARGSQSKGVQAEEAPQDQALSNASGSCPRQCRE
jgi:ferredoxin